MDIGGQTLRKLVACKTGFEKLSVVTKNPESSHLDNAVAEQ